MFHRIAFYSRSVAHFVTWRLFRTEVYRSPTQSHIFGTQCSGNSQVKYATQNTKTQGFNHILNEAGHKPLTKCGDLTVLLNSYVESHSSEVYLAQILIDV